MGKKALRVTFADETTRYYPMRSWRVDANLRVIVVHPPEPDRPYMMIPLDHVREFGLDW